MTNLDDIDKRILRVLETDGRISNVQLADRVGLSPSACLRRVQDLERTGVIEGYRAVINRSALGSGGFVVIVAVDLSRHLKADLHIFERAMHNAPQVRECHNVSGEMAYLLRVEVDDLEAYKHFHTDVLGTIEQVTSITSHIVLESPKDLRR